MGRKHTHTSEEESRLPGFELTSQRVKRLRGYKLSYRGDRLVLLIVIQSFYILLLTFLVRKNPSYRNSNSRPNLSEVSLVMCVQKTDIFGNGVDTVTTLRFTGPVPADSRQ